MLLIRKLLWKREVFWTDLLPIFSWSIFLVPRVIWKKIQEPREGAFHGFIHSLSRGKVCPSAKETVRWTSQWRWGQAGELAISVASGMLWGRDAGPV